jgi:hypothetical protein
VQPEWIFHPFMTEEEWELAAGGGRYMTSDEAEAEARAAGVCEDQVKQQAMSANHAGIVKKKVEKHGRRFGRKAGTRVR